MKRLTVILFSLLSSAMVVRAGWLDLTNDTQETTWSDSLSRSQAGQRQNLILLSYGICYYPQYFVSFRDHSAGGHNNIDMWQQRLPQYGIPDIGLLANKTNELDIFYVSGNGVLNSNAMFTNFVPILQYPTNIYNQAGKLTNDYPGGNIVTNYHQMLVVDDPPAWSADGQFGGVTLAYNAGANAAADAAGVHHIDSFRNISNAIVTGYPANSNLFVEINVPNDHPGNTYQGVWVLTTFTNALCDSNTFAAVIDFNSAVVRSTNHCTVPSISGVSNSVTYTLHADRMAPVLWHPDGVTTNEMWGAFALMPSLTNTFCEMLTFTNMPSATYQFSMDGNFVTNVTAVNGRVDVNLWMIPNQPFQAQAQSILYLMCDMLDISRTTQSNDAHPGSTLLMELYESNAGVIWATNTLGNTAYVGFMQPSENLLVPTDVLIHAAAQQTNHTVTLSLITPLFAPFHK